MTSERLFQGPQTKEYQQPRWTCGAPSGQQSFSRSLSFESVCTAFHPYVCLSLTLQSVCAGLDSEHRSLLVFLRRDVRPLPPLLPLRLPDQRVFLHPPALHQAQVGPHKCARTRTYSFIHGFHVLFSHSVDSETTRSLNIFVCVFCREHPVFLIFMQIALIAIFKLYPTVGDLSLYMAFLPVWNHLYRCKYPHSLMHACEH